MGRGNYPAPPSNTTYPRQTQAHWPVAMLIKNYTNSFFDKNSNMYWTAKLKRFNYTCDGGKKCHRRRADYNEHLQKMVSKHAQSNIPTANAVHRAQEYVSWLLDIASTSTESDSAVLKRSKNVSTLSEHSLTAGLQERSHSQSLDRYWKETHRTGKNMQLRWQKKQLNRPTQNRNKNTHTTLGHENTPR